MPALIIAVVAFLRAVVIGLKDPEFRGLLIFVVGLILLSANFYHRVEGWGYLDAVYYCVVTLATVGYGDFTPKTSEGKAYTIFFIIIGIGTFLAFANTIIAGAQKRRKEQNENRIPKEKP